MAPDTSTSVSSVSGPDVEKVLGTQEGNQSASPADQTKTEPAAASPPPPAPAPPPPSSLPSQQDAGPPPDGGLDAWLQVVGANMLLFNSWGILNAFGVFQTYYESGALFERSSSDISWIGAIQAYMVLMVGVVSGPIYDRGYLRTLVVVGCFFVVFGHMMLSLSKTYWQALLSQGFCVGIGAGCLYVPAVSVLPTYFRRRVGLAIGLASSGSSTGGVIYPIVMYRLINSIGFAWSVRVIGFIALGTLLVPIAVMRMRVKMPKARALIDTSAFADVQFLIFTLGTMIGFMGLNVLIFYTSYYAQQQHLASTTISFYLVAILNAASCFGRVLPNAASDKLGAFNIIAPCAFISGVLNLVMLAARNEASIIAITVLAGFFSGVFIALPPVCFVLMTKDKSRIGTRIGMGFSFIGLGVMAGGPAAGAILGTTEPLDWTGVWLLGGITACVSGLMYALIRVMRSGARLMVKA